MTDICKFISPGTRLLEYSEPPSASKSSVVRAFVVHKYSGFLLFVLAKYSFPLFYCTDAPVDDSSTIARGCESIIEIIYVLPLGLCFFSDADIDFLATLSSHPPRSIEKRYKKTIFKI